MLSNFGQETEAERQAAFERQEASLQADFQRQEKVAAREAQAAKMAQISATSASLAAGSGRIIQTPDYMKYLNQGNYGPKRPGAVGRAASGAGQGLLIFGILGGSVALLIFLFMMMRKSDQPAQTYPYGY